MKRQSWVWEQNTVDYENLIVNGGFEVCQRVTMTGGLGHTLTAGNKGTYFPDHWFIDVTATHTAVMTAIRLSNPWEQDFHIPPSTYGHHGRILNFSNVRGRFSLSQPIEHGFGFANRHMGWSFFARASNPVATAAMTFRLAFIEQWQEGGVQNNTLTTTTIIMPNDRSFEQPMSWYAGELFLNASEFNTVPWVMTGISRTQAESCVIMKLSLMSPSPAETSGETFSIYGVSINSGRPQPYRARPSDLELLRCKRFYETSYPSQHFNPGDLSTTACSVFMRAGNFNGLPSVNIIEYWVANKVEKRTQLLVPHVELYSPNSGDIDRCYDFSGKVDHTADSNAAWRGTHGFRFNTEASITNNAVIVFHWVMEAEYSITAAAIAK